MRIWFAFLFSFYVVIAFSQVKICSWNIENFGSSKSDSAIQFMAEVLKDFDVVALQEVVVNGSGARAVAQLADNLNRKGAKWDYVVSEATQGSAYKSERYAFLWKPSKVTKLGEPWLDQNFVEEIQREPFFCTFQFGEKEFTLVNFHAKTKRQQPETEIKYFKFFPDLYPNLNLIFLGDFNCPQKHTVFNPLKKMGYESTFRNQKTSLRQKCIDDDCLASEYDNVFYNKNRFSVIGSGVVLFYKQFRFFSKSREISDHIPVWVQII